MNAIDVRQIVKKFGDFTAVNGISFAVEDGEIFGLLGPNGAGKSTLIRMLVTLLPPTAGTAVVNGFDIRKDADGVRKSIGVIPQAMTSDLELSVEENLIIFAKLYSVPRQKREKLIDELLEAVELTKWRTAPVKNLSGGMRRRVEIARGLVHEPRIFFLDEPTTGLDPVSRVAVWEMLTNIKSHRQLTILITTHYMDEADRLCDRKRLAYHDSISRNGGTSRGRCEIALCAKHNAGRRVRPLHRAAVARRAAESLQLRHAAQTRNAAMNRMLAIIEREMRKFFRSPALMMVSMIFPLVQLIVLGNAFGGKIRDARVGLVDQDGGTQALRIREAFDSVRANMRTFEPVYYNNDKQAMEDVRNGKIQGAVVIPPQYSRRVYEQSQPRIALIVDNSDNFMSSTLEDELTQITNALNNPTVEPRMLQQTVLQIVELYPYIEYMKYLLPGSIALAMFVSVMIGGGMLYIDDKARGVHEGYLVTPITKAELVLGLNAASVVKAVMVGVVITVVGCLLAGVGTLFSFSTALGLLLMILLTAAALNTMMFLLVVRVDDPLVPRAIFGILNTLLFFPSGAVYPIQAFPWWLRGIARVDPFTFAVHGFKTLLLKEAGLSAIVPDMF